MATFVENPNRCVCQLIFDLKICDICRCIIVLLNQLVLYHSYHFVPYIIFILYFEDSFRPTSLRLVCLTLLFPLFCATQVEKYRGLLDNVLQTRNIDGNEHRILPEMYTVPKDNVCLLLYLPGMATFMPDA